MHVCYTCTLQIIAAGMCVQHMSAGSAQTEKLTQDLSGAFTVKRGIPAPHCFVFLLGTRMSKTYKDMCHNVQDSAVYCCVKAYVRDTHLQQPPVLVVAPGRQHHVGTEPPKQVIARKALSNEDINDLLKLAHLCSKKYEMPAAAQALRDVVYKREYHVAPLTWLSDLHLERCDRQASADSSNVYFPHLPDNTWELVARVT